LASAAQVRSTAPGMLRNSAYADAVVQCPSACSSCSNCLARELSLCAAAKKPGVDRDQDLPVAWSSVQTIPARRTISHPSEWSEFITIICSGWATSSVALPDGRRQILSFLLPGDIASFAGLFEPVSGPLVEAVTDVTCRTFKREELRAVLLGRRDLLEKVAETLIEERKQADELAVDLGRRTADERLSRLILKLRERLAKRGMVHEETFEFPLRQWQIADATGLTPVHVSKVLGEFHRANLIEIKDRSLTILNPVELRRIADRCRINGHLSAHRTGSANIPNLT
jgi:CRP/FNR family transcriptional regulator